MRRHATPRATHWASCVGRFPLPTRSCSYTTGGRFDSTRRDATRHAATATPLKRRRESLAAQPKRTHVPLTFFQLTRNAQVERRGTATATLRDAPVGTRDSARGHPVARYCVVSAQSHNDQQDDEVVTTRRGVTRRRRPHVSRWAGESQRHRQQVQHQYFGFDILLYTVCVQSTVLCGFEGIAMLCEQ